ncbi:MAG: PD40 domain-containing protein [Armatimonadetes bacterium]|nr:PD40 domain-containing protein [Armatimonadota bacterium]
MAGLLGVGMIAVLWRQLWLTTPAILEIQSTPAGAEIRISPPDDPTIRPAGRTPVRLQLSKEEVKRKGVWSVEICRDGYWPQLARLPASEVHGKRQLRSELLPFSLGSIGALPVVYEGPSPTTRKGPTGRAGRLDRKKSTLDLKLGGLEEGGVSWTPGANGIVKWETTAGGGPIGGMIGDWLDHLTTVGSRLGVNIDFWHWDLNILWYAGGTRRMVQTSRFPSSIYGYYVANAFSPDGEWIIHDWPVGGSDHQVLTSVITGKSVTLASPPGTDNCLPAVSPDGAKVSFVRTGASGGAQWILRDLRPAVASETIVAVVAAPSFGDTPIAFSPDGRWLAYDSGGQVLLSDRGGPPRNISASPESAPHKGLRWSPDGKWLAVGSLRNCAPWSESNGPSGPNNPYEEISRRNLSLLRMVEGHVVQTRALEGEFAGWLPDSHQFLTWNPDCCVVRLVDVQGRVVAVYGTPLTLFSSPRFSPSGNLLAAIGMDPDATPRMYLFDTLNPRPRPLRSSPVPVESFVWAGNQHLLVAGKGDAFPVWLLSVRDGKAVRLPLPQIPRRSLTAASDGKRMAYLERHGSNWGIVVCNTDGTAARQLHPPPGDYCGLSWQPHGERLMLKRGMLMPGASTGETSFIQASGAGWHRLNVKSCQNPGLVCDWLPDGRGVWLVREGVVAADPEGRIIRNDLYNDLIWSVDGRHGVSAKKGQLWLYSGSPKPFYGRKQAQTRRIIPISRDCFPHAVVAPTIPTIVEKHITGWTVRTNR